MKDSSLKFINNFLTVGRIFGIIPHSDTCAWCKCDSLQFRLYSISGVYSLILTITTFACCAPHPYILIFGERKDGNKPETLFNKIDFHLHFVFKLTLFLQHAYLFATAKRLVQVLQQFDKLTTQLYWQYYCVHKEVLTKRFDGLTCTLIAIMCMGYGFIEDILYDLQTFRKNEQFYGNLNILESYFWHSGEFWAHHLPYHPAISVFFVLATKIANGGWSYVDMLTIVFTRAIVYHLTRFNDYVIASLKHASAERHQSSTTVVAFNVVSGTSKPVAFGNTVGIDWTQIRLDFLRLCEVVTGITDYIAPLALIGYANNVVTLIFYLFFSLQAPTLGTTEGSIYTYVTFVEYTIRLILVTFFASQIHHSTEQLSKTVESCPDHLYDGTVIPRLERLLDKHPVGVSLFGTFRITRNFVVSIVSLLFTTEIVLLQSFAAKNECLKAEEPTNGSNVSSATTASPLYYR